MATEHNRIEVQMQNHRWLFYGLAGAVDHFAERAGLSEAGRRDLVEAVDQACGNTFPLLAGEDDSLRITIEDFIDRLEVTLEYHGEPLPAAGLETFAALGDEEGAPGDLTGLALMARVDRVLYDTQGNTSRMTLVKNSPPARK